MSAPPENGLPGIDGPLAPEDDPFGGILGSPAEPPPDDPTAPPQRTVRFSDGTPLAPDPESPPRAAAPEVASKAVNPGWARPQPAQQDSNIRAWLYFLAGIFLIVALWVPIRALYQRARYKPAIAGIRDADTFIALAYGGVSAGTVQGPEEVTRFQFQQQIEALRENGYNPIGLSDVREFYMNGRPLPRKAILITLEQGKKSSYLETRDILRINRWKATMFVRGDTIRDKDPSALRWPILRDMSRSGTWEIGAESVDGFRRVPTGSEGETGNFFTSPRWIAAEQRLETPEEFARRIRGEHERTVAEFTAEMGAPPAAFAFPYGDYGQYDPRAVPTRVLNLSEVGQFYGIGFSLGPFMLNTGHSDPRALNRLLVNPAWGLDQFLDILESGQAVQPWHLENTLGADRWMTDWGVAEHPEDGTLWLKAIGFDGVNTNYAPTTGALTWMVGSDNFDNFAFRMTFRVMEGQFGIRLRARPGGEEGLRVLFDRNGNCWVKQKVYGAEEFTQATARDIAAYPGKEQTLEISLWDRTLFATLNGKMLLTEPLDLMGTARPGLFGLEVWNSEPGTAATQIVELQFPRPKQVLKYWSPEQAPDVPSLMMALHADAPRLAAISPPWMDAVRAIPLVLPQWDDQTVRTFAGMHGIPVLPRITLRSAEIALQIPPELPAEEALAMKADGVHVDCRRVAKDDVAQLVPWLQQVHNSIKEHDMKLAIQFPPAVERMVSFGSIAAMFSGALIAVETSARAEEMEESLPGIVVAEPVSAQASEMHLNLYYQLASRALPSEALSPMARQDLLRREGYLAYQEGDYDKAIEKWGAWLAEDPHSAEAHSLIGRAWLQKGDLEHALESYTKSLEAGPGQVHMVIRRSELLERMDRSDEAREQLNLYARIFPENPDILIAQAQWLDRNKRRTEARAMVQTLVDEAPMNLSARIALLNLQDSSSNRYRTMRGMLSLGASPDSQIPFGQSLLSMEMLTYPESAVFFDYIRDQAKRGQTTKQRELYESFLPLTNRVTDDFASGRLSDGWIASGGIRALDRGRYDLRAAIDQAETYLRLRRSELIRDGFLEVVLDESQGLFWIYARRSSRAMVRFGFDQEGFIHLQAWLSGELVSHNSRPWIRPPGSMTIRLEVRGDGMRGFVNGLEIFDAPVEIPKEIAYGWWGIAPFSFDLGVARARIIRMDCEPLPATFVLVPHGNPSEQVAAMRPFVGGISALVPAWFFQNPDGTLPMEFPPDSDILRMFAAFHRIRLLPAVDLSYSGDVDPQEVVDLIRRLQLPGVVLKRRAMPKKEWLDAMDRALEGYPANVVVLQTEAALWNTPRAGEESRGEMVVRPEVGDHLLPKPGETIYLHEFPIGNVVVAPLRDSWNLQLRAPDDEPEAAVADVSTPQLYLLGRDGKLSMPPPP
jgi:tetratricopeptide (TPR) repeat protein/peptidoglycan/xylan/chitin deacetylase (PgdA/CDA1 family)